MYTHTQTYTDIHTRTLTNIHTHGYSIYIHMSGRKIRSQGLGFRVKPGRNSNSPKRQVSAAL